MGKIRGAGDMPFNRGETFYGGAVPDAANLKGGHLLGRMYYVDDEEKTAGKMVLTKRGNRDVVLMCVRNTAGINLLPKKMVALAVAGGPDQYLAEATGYATAANEFCLPVDEFLPAAGVVDDDVFYVVVQGTAKVKLPTVGGGFNGDIAIGNFLIGATINTTSGNSTAGGIGNITVNATSALQAVSVARNIVARALEAATTGQTGEDLLVDICQIHLGN